MFTEDVVERYRINETDPLSARSQSEWSVRLQRPDREWDVSVTTRSEISCDTESFHTVNHVTAYERETVLFDRVWKRAIPRTGG